MIEFTTSLLMIASAFSPATTTAHAAVSEDAKAPAPVQAAVTATTTIAAEAVTASQPKTIQETEQYVREYYKDTPILAEIARCESSFRQYGKDGQPLKGIVNKGDIGVMQINRYYHEEDASALGLDIYTLDGNLEFAKILYGKYGDKPWVSSSKCWSNPRIDTAVIAKA